jgi:hypothetical protein
MAVIEPGRLFQFDRPLVGAQVDAVLMQGLLEALARTNFTTDTAYPSAPREGMLRINASDSSNVKLEVFQGSPGTWKVLLQHLETGVASPTKQIIQFLTPQTSWLVDHNLGSQPIVQTFDSGFNLLTAGVSSLATLFLGHVPAAVLTSRTGVQSLRAAFPMPGAGVVTATRALASEEIVGAPSGQVEFELSGAGGPMTGGEIALSAAALGQNLAGAAITGNNSYGAGETLLVQTDVATAPAGGALDIYADVLAAGGGYTVAHPTPNRVIVTHPVATSGFMVLIG